MHPGVEYEFYVQSFGVRGDGPSTAVLIVRTADAAPTQAPARLRVMEAAMDEILVAWDPPADSPVSGYRYRLLGSI